ncbi:hypothetical protein GIB67_041367 [Kingdonia uniflora]|uniref:ATP-dependent DNA helicase n=1 Tax=Kingdonia uniflora TaxID=39325 RepID=A0A7J7NJH6_9MAGN|nr:hypothetical protein GIB67_041367 [Kingdonia uniflora]
MSLSSHISRFFSHKLLVLRSRFLTTTNNNNSSNNNCTLSKQQQEVLDAISKRKSIFITGSAGTGKTHLLLQIIKTLKTIYKPREVFVTASTGIAAFAINGQTIHSFAGVGFSDADTNVLLNRVVKNKFATNRWRNVKALVIDEISMINGHLFDDLEYIAREVRPVLSGEVESWGGIQLIVCGDFFQLPPVNKGEHIVKEFAFEANCWKSSFDLLVELTRVYRQSDPRLLVLLQGIRRGYTNTHHLEILKQCCKRPIETTVVVPRLYPMNDDVKRVNDANLGLLRRSGKEIFTYRANDKGECPWKDQLKSGIAPDTLELCIGARVMLIKNKDFHSGLVNGATGTVINFVKKKDAKGDDRFPEVEFDNGIKKMIEEDKWKVIEGEMVLATRSQVPLILAWALTIHKCQGMTLKCFETDLSKTFGCGMVYVALSRVKSLEGLHLNGFDPSKIKANAKVPLPLPLLLPSIEQLNNWDNSSFVDSLTKGKWGHLPKVRFDFRIGKVIEKDKWDVIEGEMVLATRRQMPLILAWVFTIHKCQGMILKCLETDLSKAFGCMVYAALSRVKSLGGLHLIGFC